MNRCIISGEVSSYGPNISWTDAGKPQTSLTLDIEKGGYHTFIPVMIVGAKAETVAETINAGDYLIIEGSLGWKAGRSKETGRLQVVAFEVEVLSTQLADGSSVLSDESAAYQSEGVETIVQPRDSQAVSSQNADVAAPATKARRQRYPRAALEGGFRN